jgi:hypothetical protein
MIQVIIPESMQLFYYVGFVGFIISFVLALVFLFRNDISNIARTYMIGAVATFYVGGFTIVNPFIVYFWGYIATWTSPFGLIGGYALIVIAFAQLWLDRTKSETGNIESNYEE